MKDLILPSDKSDLSVQLLPTDYYRVATSLHSSGLIDLIPEFTAFYRILPAMERNRGIALRLSFWILTGITVILSVILTTTTSFPRIILRNVEKDAENLTSSTVYRIDSVLRTVEKVPKNSPSLWRNLPIRARTSWP